MMSPSKNIEIVETTSKRDDAKGLTTADMENVEDVSPVYSPAKTPEPEEPSVDYSSKAKNISTFKDYLRIFTYSTTTDKIFLALACLGEIGTGTTLPLMVIVFGNLVGSFGNYFIPGSTVTEAEFKHSLNQQTLYLVYLFIARWVLSYFSLLIFRIVGLRISAKLRLQYLQQLFSLPIYIIDMLPSGQASNTLTNTANILQVGISEKLGVFLQFTALFFTALIIAFVKSWSLTLVTSSVLVFVAIVYSITIPINMKLQRDVDHSDEKAAGIAGEVLGSIRMIVACGAEGRIAKKYSGWVQESRRRGEKLAPFIGAQFAPLFFTVYAAMSLCFWFGFKQYLAGHVADVGTIVVVLMSVTMTAFSLSQTAAPIIAITKAQAAATDFFAVIDAPKPGMTGIKDPEVSPQDDISLNSVTFAYPSRPHVKVLDDCSLRFESGKITAIVGASGSGKSTIVGLLQRWYVLDQEKLFQLPESVVKDDKTVAKEKEEAKQRKKEEKKAKRKGQEIKERSPAVIEEKKPSVPLSGAVMMGNHNLDTVDLKWWRSQIGLVQQEPFIFNETIRKNVEFGLIGSEWEHADPEKKMELVEAACKEAFADEFITKLPLGYDTAVGDAGIKLSGGQRQRLAIARSIIKRPKILILDEATSAIDVRGERLVQAALDRASAGRTTITIAHRLSTIKKADKIIVLKKGKVVEEGTHNGLLENENGAYWALVNAQKLTIGDDYAGESDLIETRDELKRALSSGSCDANELEQEAPYKQRGFFGSFGTLLAEQTSQKWWYLLLALGCCGCAAGNPIQSWVFAQLINVITYPRNLLGHESSKWALVYFYMGLGLFVAYFLVGWSASVVSSHVSTEYRQQYFESILRKKIPFFDEEENSSGTLTARVANDPTQLQQMLGMNMALVYIAILSLVGCVIIGFYFGWKLTLVVFFVCMPIVLLAGYFRIRYEIQFEAMNQAVFAESSKFAAESIGAFRTVTALTLEDMICIRYNTLLDSHLDLAFKKARWTTAVFAASDSIQLLCMALGFWYGGQLLANKSYGPVQFFVVYMAVVQGAEGAGTFLSFGPNMAQAAAAANRILSFRARPINKLKTPAELTDTKGGIKLELQDLWFKYPTRDTPIFTGLSITIEKGQFAALVGASGCGKTSIVSLLERFYEVQRGKILANGTNILELDIQEYRKTLSLVAQEPTLFQGTIKENIFLGVEENTSTELLHRACRDAEIHDFIMSLPDGYNTDVGTKGVALSGGQKQRLSIARALIRDPKILLLDEATSSLDSESEKLVQAAFERAASGRTMVVVAHRLATVQNADVIFVLGEGKVLEIGNHQQLLRKKGVYYQMCQSQALDR